MKTKKVGVLALQGAFAKHLEMLQSIGAQGMPVRKPTELAECAALIIPGGESTTIFHQLNYINLLAPLREFAKSHPLFGTCAGMILMSKTIVANPDLHPLELIDISVERNAFGRQTESFRSSVEVSLPKKAKRALSALFIRAPRIKTVGPDVKVLSALGDEAILVQQGHHLAASFHPELSGDPYIHEYFLTLIN